MKTLLYIIKEDNVPEFLAESVETDIPIFEGSIISIEEEGTRRTELYEVLSEIWSMKVWKKNAEATRNLYLAKSLIREDNKIKKGVIESYGPATDGATDKNGDKQTL